MGILLIRKILSFNLILPYCTELSRLSFYLIFVWLVILISLLHTFKLLCTPTERETQTSIGTHDNRSAANAL